MAQASVVQSEGAARVAADDPYEAAVVQSVQKEAARMLKSDRNAGRVRGDRRSPNPPREGSKAAFIMGLPQDLPINEMIRRAEAAGHRPCSRASVHTIRYTYGASKQSRPLKVNAKAKDSPRPRKELPKSKRKMRDTSRRADGRQADEETIEVVEAVEHPQTEIFESEFTVAKLEQLIVHLGLDRTLETVEKFKRISAALIKG